MTVNAVKGGDGFCKGGAGGSNEFSQKVSALKNLSVLPTGKDEGLEKCEEVGPLYIQFCVEIRPVRL